MTEKKIATLPIIPPLPTAPIVEEIPVGAFHGEEEIPAGSWHAEGAR